MCISTFTMCTYLTYVLKGFKFSEYLKYHIVCISNNPHYSIEMYNFIHFGRKSFKKNLRPDLTSNLTFQKCYTINRITVELNYYCFKKVFCTLILLVLYLLYIIGMFQNNNELHISNNVITHFSNL